MVIAHGILNLQRREKLVVACPESEYEATAAALRLSMRQQLLLGNCSTYVHVDLLAITFLAAHDSSHNDQLILRHEVADTSLVVAVAGGEFEFKGGCKLDYEEE